LRSFQVTAGSKVLVTVGAGLRPATYPGVGPDRDFPLLG